MALNWQVAQAKQTDGVFSMTACGYRRERPVALVPNSKVVTSHPSFAFVGMPSETPSPNRLPNLTLDILKDPRTHAMSVVVAPASQDRIKRLNHSLRRGIGMVFQPIPNRLDKSENLLFLGHWETALRKQPDIEPQKIEAVLNWNDSGFFRVKFKPSCCQPLTEYWDNCLYFCSRRCRDDEIICIADETILQRCRYMRRPFCFPVLRT